MQKSVPARRLALFRRGTLALLFSVLAAPVFAADSRPTESIAPVATYADLADLTAPTALVVKAQVRKVAEVEPERAAGLRAGWARLYIEARTEAVLGGRTTLGEALRYLVDVPRDAKGKPPKLGKRSVILFARPVAGRPGELQLVAPDAQLLWDPALESRVKAVLAEFYAPSAPRAIGGLREVIHVPGALAGEGETQFFLTSTGGEPMAITVSRMPGTEPRWAVSFSELVESGAPPPARETLAWYRLACFLPRQLAPGVNVSAAPEDRQAAARDYRFVLEQLGACPRLRR
ncbi:MAG: hypothetical protein RL299_2337 [Pseudomonadota bacterium]